jgi:hypothetical protein
LLSFPSHFFSYFFLVPHIGDVASSSKNVHAPSPVVSTPQTSLAEKKLVPNEEPLSDVDGDGLKSQKNESNPTDFEIGDSAIEW